MSDAIIAPAEKFQSKVSPVRLRDSLRRWTFLLLAPAALAHAAGESATSPNAAAPPWWNLHGQFTNVTQYHPSFTSPYAGANSLAPGNSGRETSDITLYGGLRLWNGAALYVNPEFDEGYGLSDTLGVAGFPSGEAYKVGARNPYFRLQRAFVRQVITLSPAQTAAVADGPNQLADVGYADNLTITVGKFSVVDIFDTNQYAHDPRADFMNWGLIDGGAFDYPADAWGYTYGGAVEWTQSWWSLRGGTFALSKIPNTKDIDGQFHQFGLVVEGEERHTLADHPGRIKLLAFVNRGRMGTYSQALALAQRLGSIPETALVRRYGSRPGLAANLEQELAPDLGGFVRASLNSGDKEAYEFTEINRSLAAGLSLQGQRWQRPEDTVGVAALVNALSPNARAYFAAGGTGILIGDGRINYGLEKILESYYALQVAVPVTLTADLQYVLNPAYNHDRGPVTILGLRLHAQF